MRLRVNGDWILSAQARIPRGWFARGWGWMGAARPAPDAALLFPRCRSLHTGFMRFALDIAFLDDRGRVLEVRAGVRPWRFATGPRGTASCLEMPAGAMAGLRPGDTVAAEDAPAGEIKSGT